MRDNCLSLQLYFKVNARIYWMKDSAPAQYNLPSIVYLFWSKSGFEFKIRISSTLGISSPKEQKKEKEKKHIKIIITYVARLKK